jgi:maltose/maltodextrin transport system substrate-binding protein/arabinogalactan oligomer/maltooligosaccharide transport system substrate-binding protein
MSKLYKAILPFIIAAMILSACAPAATQAPAVQPTTAPTEAPKPTDTPVPATATTAPTEAPQASDTPAAPAVTDTPAPTPTVTPLAAKEGTLTIWADANRVKALKGVIENFTAKTNVPVAVQELGFGDIRDQLKIAGPAGEGADIIIGAHDWLGELVSNGLLETMDLPADVKAKFDPVALQAFSYNGKLYGVPYGVEAVALIYNKDLVPTPPKTWAEMETIAKQLQDEKKVDQGYVLQQGDPYHTYPLVTAFGGYVFGKNPDGSYNPEDLGLDNAGGLAAAAELDKMVKEGLLRKDVDYNLMASLFADKKSAMMIGGPWMMNDIKKAGINYGITNIPSGPGGKAVPFVGVQGFMVSAFAKNKDLAKAFLTEYLASDEVMQALYDVEPRSPAWLPVRNKLDNPDLKAFGASAANGTPMPAIPQMSAVWEAWGKSITLIFQQQQAPDQAVKDASKTIRDKIAQSK